METVLLKAGSFVLVILVGILLRTSGLVPEDSGETIKKILMNVTLPAAVIINFSRMDSLDISMLLILVLGFFCNVVMVFVGYLVTAKRNKSDRAIYMLCLPAANIGAFSLPFVQSFLPALGVAAVCMYDVGNSIMCLGGTYAVTDTVVNKGKSRFQVLPFIKKLLSSPSLIAYLTMFLLTISGIRLPDALITLVEPAANANIFTAMLMIGLLFRLDLKPEYIRDIIGILGLRLAFAVVASLLVYNLLPFDLVVRQAVVIVLFAPLSAAAPAFVGDCGGDQGKASAANSFSILVGILSEVLLLIGMGLY